MHSRAREGKYPLAKRKALEIWGRAPSHNLSFSLRGAFLAVQWLGLHASTAGGIDSFPDQGTRIPKPKEKELISSPPFSEGNT